MTMSDGEVCMVGKRFRVPTIDVDVVLASDYDTLRETIKDALRWHSDCLCCVLQDKLREVIMMTEPEPEGDQNE